MYRNIKYVFGINIIRALLGILFFVSLELSLGWTIAIFASYVLCDVLLGIVFWKMRTIIYWFKKAAFCFGFIVISFGIMLLSIIYDDIAFLLIIVSITLLCLSTLIEKYMEFKGYQSVICITNYRLSRLWKLLWKWYSPFYIIMYVSYIYTLISLEFPLLNNIPIVGTVTFIATSMCPLGLFVIGIFKWILFYKTIRFGKKGVDGYETVV